MLQKILNILFKIVCQLVGENPTGLIVKTLGRLIGKSFWWCERKKWIILYGREYLINPNELGTIIVSNHPSYLDPFILPGLYFPDFVKNPEKYLPYGTPDWDNFYNHWYFAWVKYAHTIPIYRQLENKTKNLTSVKRMLQVLTEGKTIIIFPEGGRTFKRKQKIINSSGRELGKLIDIVERITKRLEKQVRVIPIWINGSDLALPDKKWIPRIWQYPITITIGQPIIGTVKTEKLEQILLQLADQIN